jgi:amino acid permease
MQSPKTIIEHANFRFVKIMDIGYITAIYFIVGLIFSRLFDKLFGEFDTKKEDNKNIVQVGAELIGMIWIIGISTYVVRNLVELIPSPFDGIAGLIHKKLKELSGAGVYTMIVMGYAFHFRAKLDAFNRRLNRTLNIPIPNIFLTPKGPEVEKGIELGQDGYVADN